MCFIKQKKTRRSVYSLENHNNVWKNMKIDLLIFAVPQAILMLFLSHWRLGYYTEHEEPVQPSQATAHCPYSAPGYNPIKECKCKLALVFLWQKPAGSYLLCCSSALNVHRLLLNYDKGTYTFIIEELCNKTWQLNLLIMLMQFSIRFDFKQFTKNICSKLLWTS